MRRFWDVIGVLVTSDVPTETAALIEKYRKDADLAKPAPSPAKSMLKKMMGGLSA